MSLSQYINTINTFEFSKGGKYHCYPVQQTCILIIK